MYFYKISALVQRSRQEIRKLRRIEFQTARKRNQPIGGGLRDAQSKERVSGGLSEGQRGHRERKDFKKTKRVSQPCRKHQHRTHVLCLIQSGRAVPE